MIGDFALCCDLSLQMILSFELPFALIPLLKFSGSSSKMGPHKNSVYVSTRNHRENYVLAACSCLHFYQPVMPTMG